MDIKKLRYMNARHLLRHKTQGVNDFAERIGRAQSQTSAYIGERPTKNIGDKMARIIEAAFDKESGWLDTRHEDIDPQQRAIIDSIPRFSLAEKDDTPAYVGEQYYRIMKEIATNSLRYNELRDDIYELKREQNMAHHAMESYGASLVCLGLEAYGYILEEDQYFNQAERNEFMFSQGQRWNSRFDPFDFILSDIEGEKLGLYICLATPAGGLYPIRAFVPPNEDIGIEPRIALIVVKGEDIHFFLVPLEDIGTRKPLLRVRGRDTENPVYFLGRSNITHLKDSFDIKIKKLSHQERLARQSRIMQGVLEHMQNPEE